MAQIELEGICKTFTVYQRPEGRLGLLRGAFARERKSIQALEDISFRIDEGELVGYIGPNGAGKSTTVKIMSGILTPGAGNCRIMNRIPWRDRVAHVSGIGVVFGQRSQLWWDVPVSDSFDLLKDIYDISASDYKQRLKELAETLDLAPLLKTPVRQLSLGQRMRCEIAASLLHRPRILFLDEPTIGLDAVSKLALRDFLKNENLRNGVTMILTTHDMDDIGAMCSRVMVIGRGRLLYDDGLSALKEKYAPLRRIRATLSGSIENPEYGCLDLSSIEGAVQMNIDKNICTVMFNPQHTPAHNMVERLSKKFKMQDMIIEEQDIDEIIAAMYKEMCL